MNIDNLKIRNAKINDIEKILEIEHNSFDKNICEDKKDFYEIWENRFNTPYFQKRDISTTKCKNCKYIALCGTGCMASAYKKYGDINAAPAECTYYQEYLKEQYE